MEKREEPEKKGGGQWKNSTGIDASNVVSVLASFLSIWQEVKLSKWRKSQLKKMLP